MRGLKHIDIQWHYQGGEDQKMGQFSFDIYQLITDQQIADGLTKPLPKNKFLAFRNALGFGVNRAGYIQDEFCASFLPFYSYFYFYFFFNSCSTMLHGEPHRLWNLLYQRSMGVSNLAIWSAASHGRDIRPHAGAGSSPRHAVLS